MAGEIHLSTDSSSPALSQSSGVRPAHEIKVTVLFSSACPHDQALKAKAPNVQNSIALCTYVDCS